MLVGQRQHEIEPDAVSNPLLELQYCIPEVWGFHPPQGAVELGPGSGSKSHFASRGEERTGTLSA